MELLARLEPRLDPNECLVPGLTERRTIELKTYNITSVILGRGNTTGISDRSIGLQVVEISFDEFSKDEQSVRATILKDAERCKVHVNGVRFPDRQLTTFLSSGDVISLDGLRYEYRLHLSFQGDTPGSKRKSNEQEVISVSSTPSKTPEMSSPAVAALPSEEIVATLSSSMASRVSDEVQCCVCLDIQVYPRTLDPCGHSFCACCLKKLTNCPQCRETINSHVPSMQLDNLICLLVSVPSLFDKDDIAHYHQRKKGEKIAPVVYHTKKRGAKRRRNRSSMVARFDYEDPFQQFMSQLSVPTSEGMEREFVMPASRSIDPPTSAGYPSAAGNEDFPLPLPLSPSGASLQPGHNAIPPQQRAESASGTSSADAISID